MVSRSAFNKRRIILAGTSLAAITLASAAHAGPSGGTVSAGAASITGDGTSHVTVTQTSDRAILDWNSFSIGAGESARFVQPGTTSVAVNRVTGADPSSILGNLTANGRVVLINRNGIAFGKDATVDVGGIVATTADIDRHAFMATGSLTFSGGSLPGASVVNEGRITVRDAGLAALVAPSVRNSGTIVADLGRVALGAGTGFTVDFCGDGLVSFAPDGIVAATIGDGGTALVETSGVIAASGGKVVLSAAAARDVVNASVNVTGVVRADSINNEGGSIVLSGPGAVKADGTLSANSAEGAGGRIDVTGRTVEVGGLVSAHGATGGGLVRIGGAFQGGKPSDPRQTYFESFLGRWGTLPAIAVTGDTTIGSSALIDVSASRGAGGTAVVWSEQRTTVLGAIDASGVSGGSVEVSSAQDLLQTDLSAIRIGRGGFLLLDPKNIVIGASGDTTPTSGNYEYADTPSLNAPIDASGLAGQLSTGASIILQAHNDITVSSAITVDNALGDGGDLTLQAGRSVIVNANITTDNGDLTLIGNDSSANGVDDTYRDAGSAVITTGAATVINAGTGAVTIDLRDGAGRTKTTAGSITLGGFTAASLDVDNRNAAGDIQLNGNITTTGVQDYRSERDVKVNTGSVTISSSGETPISLTAGRQIILSGTSQIRNTNSTATSTFDAIILNANQANAASDANLHGIYGDNTKITTSGYGNIRLTGRGIASSSNAHAARTGIAFSNSTIQSDKGDISATGYGGGGSANLALAGVLLQWGAKFQTADGHIDIKAYGSDGATASSAAAFDLNTGMVEATGSGTITILGDGGDSNGLHGIRLNTVSRFQTASGALSITGHGGNGTAMAHGVSISGGTITAGGTLTMDGTGGDEGGHGISVDGTISAASSAGITMTGTATGSTGNNSGILISGSGNITSASGNIALTAISSGLGGNLPALYLFGSGSTAIQSSGGGHITLSGTRSNGIGEGVWIGNSGSRVQTTSGDISITGVTSSNTYDGVRIAGAGRVSTSAGGDITLTGTTATGGTATDIGMIGTGALGVAATGDITLNGDTMGIVNTATMTGSGVLTFQTRTNGRSIGLGTGATGDLKLGAGSLASPLIDGFSEIVIGNAQAGTINLANSLLAFKDNLRLISAGDLTFTSNSSSFPLDVGSNRLTLDIAGSTTQSGTGAFIKAGSLLLLGSNAIYSLTHTDNAISTLAASAKTISLTHGGTGNLTVDTVGTTQGIVVDSVSIATSKDGAGIVINRNVTTSGAQTYTATLGSITVNSDADLLVTGKAALTLTAGSQISISGGTLENNYDDEDGAFDAIVLRANDDATPFALGGTNQALALQGGGTLRTAAGGGGNITLFGRGGDGSTNGIGVQINHGIIESHGAGTISIEGHGGAGIAGNIKYGVLVQDAPSGSNGGSRIESNLGDITITGTGGTLTTGINNIGVAIIQKSQVRSTGTGADAAKITITGTGGGTGTSYGNVGVTLSDATTRVESIDGAISIMGLGGANAEGAGNSNQGIMVSGGAVVESTGTGANAATITLNGTGGGKGAASGNIGVIISGSGTSILAEDGDISIEGTGSAAAEGNQNYGIALSAAANIASSGNAAIMLEGQGGGMSASNSATNIGVYLASPGTSIESEKGDISLIGTGGAGSDSSDAHHYGVQIGLDTQVRSTGTGSDAADISLSGTGGGGTGNKRIGVYLNADQALLSNTGAITVTGRGGAAPGGTGNDGLYVSGTGTKITSGSGEIVVDAAKGGGTGKDLNNLTGNTAIQSTSGRWIIYLTHPDDSTFNNLASGNLPVWGKTIATLPSSSVSTGNHYVFSHQPTLTLSTSFNDTKTYGIEYTFPTPAAGSNYAFTGIVNASSYQSVWTQETLSDLGFSGAPVFSSAGAAAGADVTGSPYAVSIVNGTLGNTAGYQFGTPVSTGTLTVTPKALTLTGVSAAGKDYDGNTDATLSGGTLSGIIGSDDVAFSAGTGSFADKNVGTWAVTASGYALSGGDAGNYTLTQPLVANAEITAKSLTLIGVSAAGKPYDGSTDATLSGGTLVGIVGNEDVTFATGTGSFADKTVGTWAVTVVGYALTGGDAGNYVIVQPTVADAAITPRTLSAGVAALDKTYDGTRDAALAFSTSDIVGGDSVTFDYDAWFSDRNAGTDKAVSLTSGVTLIGADAANYTLVIDPGALASLTADISARTLTVSGLGALGKTYDGASTAELAFTTADVLSGDTVTFTYTADFADSNAGTGKGVAVTGVSLSGVDAGNYALALDAALLLGLSADIDRKALTLDGVRALGKTYDGTRNVTLDFDTDDVVSGDNVGFLYEALAADRNAGTGKTITVTGGTVSLSGADAANYDLALDPGLLSGLSLDIAARTVTISTVAAQNKVYDGTRTASLAITSAGIVGGDDATFGYNARFADKAAGIGKSVTVAESITLSGSDASNYLVALDPALLGDLSADISAKTLGIADVRALGKTYDGTRNVTLDFDTDDVVSGDNVGFLYEALAADRNAGTGKTITVTGGTVSLSGADAANYDLALTDDLLSGLTIDVAAKALTVVVDDQSRARYQPNPAFTYHLVGLAQGDDAALVSGMTFLTSATQASPAGDYTIAATGGSAPNYILAYTPGTLTVTGHLVPPYDQNRIVHGPESLSGGDGFGGLVSIVPVSTLYALTGYAGGATIDGGANGGVPDSRGPFCSNPGNRTSGRRLLPYLQINMTGRTLYCLGSPSRFAQ